MALNFKGVPYSTTWVPLPDVAKVRSSLKIPACRKFADGTDFFTLPIIEDPNTNSSAGDSFDIAVHLQQAYPDSGAGDLFPPNKIEYVFNPPNPIMIPLSEIPDSPFPEYAKFNVNVDAAFTCHVQLGIREFPFDPATAEISKAEMARRGGVKSWDDYAIEGEPREKLKESFRQTLGDLGQLFLNDPSGPFIFGTRASYADLIVGGWLHNMRATLPESEWEEIRSWHDGLFGRIYDALEVFSEVK